MFGNSIYRIVLVAIFASAAATAALLFRLTAPYGKHVRPGWGFSMHPRWAWLVMESPAVFVIALVCAAALSGTGQGHPEARVTPVSIVLLGLWELHYVYRTFVYPFMLREGRRRDFPFVLVLMAIVYNTANGYVNGRNLFFGPGSYPLEWLLDIRFIVGVVIFAGGFIMHVQSDSILRALRSPGESEYRIPDGGMFRYVSSPNYLGEIVQWTGFAIATWSLAGVSFAVFSAANLVPRAVSNHRWYQRTFPDYPVDRTAFIPLPKSVWRMLSGAGSKK